MILSTCTRSIWLCSGKLKYTKWQFLENDFQKIQEETPSSFIHFLQAFFPTCDVKFDRVYNFIAVFSLLIALFSEKMFFFPPT